MPLSMNAPAPARAPVRRALLDLLALAGLALFLRGVWLAWPPAAFMLGGAVTVALAVLLSRVPPPSPRGDP